MQIMSVNSWSDYKTLVTNKTLLMQYSDDGNTYNIFAPEAQTFLWNISLLKGTSDATDFENNYKSAANAPMMLLGQSVVTPLFEESNILNALAIRDTVSHTSSSSAGLGYLVKTVVYSNLLNQDVVIQLQASRDDSTYFNVGASWTATAGTTGWQSTDDYFPFMRCTAICSVSPSSGTLSVWLEKMGS